MLTRFEVKLARRKGLSLTWPLFNNYYNLYIHTAYQYALILKLLKPDVCSSHGVSDLKSIKLNPWIASYIQIIHMSDNKNVNDAKMRTYPPLWYINYAFWLHSHMQLSAANKWCTCIVCLLLPPSLHSWACMNTVWSTYPCGKAMNVYNAIHSVPVPLALVLWMQWLGKG